MTSREWCDTMTAEAVRVLSDHFGNRAKVERGNASYTDTSFGVKFTFLRPDESGNVVSPAADNFRRYAEVRGFDAADLGREFSSGGQTYTITGWNSRARTMPVQAKRDDGRGFKFSSAVVLRALGKPVPEPLYRRSV